MKSLLVLSVLLSPPVLAANEAPANFERDSYLEWLATLDAPEDPYAEGVFAWNEQEATRELPKEVHGDPEKIFVNVARAIAECDAAEKDGTSVAKGTTFGLDAYAVINAPVSEVLKTSLFRWGKPLNAPGGVTRKKDNVYGLREDRIEQIYGPGGYRSRAIRKIGGLAKDQDDYYTVLVRGNEAEGFVIVGSFLKKAGESETTSYFSVTRIRPLPGGKTDYRLTGRYTGQSYGSYGTLESMRKQYGFNVKRIRDEIKGFIGDVQTLLKTGSIPQEKR